MTELIMNDRLIFLMIFVDQIMSMIDKSRLITQLLKMINNSNKKQKVNNCSA